MGARASRVQSGSPARDRFPVHQKVLRVHRLKPDQSYQRKRWFFPYPARPFARVRPEIILPQRESPGGKKEADDPSKKRSSNQKGDVRGNQVPSLLGKREIT